jgi:hypothetical protein
MKPLQNLHARSSRRESALISSKARGEVEPTHVGCYSFFLTLLLAAILASAGRAFGGEIWLSSTNSLAWLGQQTNFGAGALSDPYYGDFDYLMGHFVPANSTVHLGSGIFWTKGNYNFQIPGGVTLSGEGESVTMLRRATNYPGYGLRVYCSLNSTYSNITVCNLTVDNNAFDCLSNGWTNAVLGVGLLGSGETLEHVTDINGYGKDVHLSPEGFQLSVGNYDQHDNKVVGCTVSNFLGAYGDGIAGTGDCVVEGNRVYLPPQPAGVMQLSVFGINICGSMNGSYITGNYVYGGMDGFHNDTGGDTNLTIAHNVFENICSGVNLTGDDKPYNSVIISHNVMTQQTNYTDFQDQMFVVTLTTTQVGETNQNIVVEGNTIRYYQNVPFASDGSQGALYINAGPGQLNENISIFNNQIDARMPVSFAGNISNLYASGNLPLNGTNFATANGNPGLTNVIGSQTVSQH